MVLALIIVVTAVLFIAGMTSSFWRSPNSNPLARLAQDGIETNAKVVALEPDGDEPNITVEYQVSGTDYKRSVPWKPNAPLPEIGANVRLRYLPTQPGLSRLM
jgi:hypothetical protein